MKQEPDKALLLLLLLHSHLRSAWITPSMSKVNPGAQPEVGDPGFMHSNAVRAGNALFWGEGKLICNSAISVTMT